MIEQLRTVTTLRPRRIASALWYAFFALDMGQWMFLIEKNFMTE